MSLSNDDIDLIKQLLTAMENRMNDRMDKRFSEFGKKIDKRFEQVDKRLDGIDERLDGIDERLDNQDVQLNEILNAVGTEFNDQSANITSNTASIDDHERRIVRLERKAA